MTNVSLLDCDNKHKQFCLLAHIEEQLSTTLNFQCQLLKSLLSVTLNATQQFMLNNLLHEQALSVTFRSAHAKTTIEIAQRLLDYNLGTMLH